MVVAMLRLSRNPRGAFIYFKLEFIFVTAEFTPFTFSRFGFRRGSEAAVMRIDFPDSQPHRSTFIESVLPRKLKLKPQQELLESNRESRISRV